MFKNRNATQVQYAFNKLHEATGLSPRTEICHRCKGSGKEIDIESMNLDGPYFNAQCHECSVCKGEKFITYLVKD